LWDDAVLLRCKDLVGILTSSLDVFSSPATLSELRREDLGRSLFTYIILTFLSFVFGPCSGSGPDSSETADMTPSSSASEELSSRLLSDTLTVEDRAFGRGGT